MNKIIFATNNQHKVDEMKSILGHVFQVVSLKEAGILVEIPEPYNTLEENAWEKSRTIFRLVREDCFSEDTGLEVDALAGQPGVRSARFAGEKATSDENVAKLLHVLSGNRNRNARFRTVISLMMNGVEHQFEGICEGEILEAQAGDGGFGYDAVFAPFGSTQSFAEMTTGEKNKYSHRKKAAEKLALFLSQNWKKSSN